MPVFQRNHEEENIVSRVSLSDIELTEADSGVTFSNIFLAIEAKLRRILESKVIRYRHQVLVDSFVTGVQSLLRLGERKPTKRIGLAPFR